MGNALGGIGKALGGVVKQVAPSIIKAVAPAATKILKGITDGFITKGADMLKGLTSALPSPIAKLAGSLIGKGADFLKNLAGGGIEKGLAKLTELVTKRLGLPGVGNVSVPGLATPERQAAIQNNTPATGSSSSAATGSAGSTGSSAPSATSSGITSPPDPKNYGDLQDQNNMQKLLKDQQAYQTNFSAMQNYWSMISNIMKANFQTLQGMAQNLR